MKRQIAMSNLHNFQYRIYYEDTDAGGIVYYANYLKFFERARTDFLRSQNISQSDLKQKENLLFVVRKCNIEYLSPARLDDIINVSVATKEIRSASIIFHQEIKRNDVILTRLEVEIVCIESDNSKPKKIPEYIKTTITK